MPLGGFCIATAIAGGITGTLKTLHTHLSSGEEVAKCTQMLKEETAENDSKVKFVDDCSAALKEALSDKEVKEIQLAWRKMDMEKHIANKEYHHGLMKKVADSQSLIKNAYTQLSSLRNQVEALKLCVAACLYFSPNHFRLRILVHGIFTQWNYRPHILACGNFRPIILV